MSGVTVWRKFHVNNGVEITQWEGRGYSLPEHLRALLKPESRKR